MDNPVFVTGQQIGLLGGPLYTTYKVLGAVTLARQNDGNAVYWLETNDADFAEINHFTYLDKANHLKTLRWDKDTGGLSCGLIQADEELVEILNRFFDDLTPTEWTESLRKLALSCYQPGEMLGKASFNLASALYGGFGIRVFDPSDDKFLSEIRPILEAEISATEPGKQCNAFLRVNGKRLALFKTETGVVFRDNRPADLETGRLLPNLKTRNICQDAYFGTDTYVAGPGEMAYISELGPRYVRHGVQKARVQRRMSAVLLEPRTKRLLERIGLTVAEVTGQEREALLKFVRNRESGVNFSALKAELSQKTKAYLDVVEQMGLDSKRMRKALAPAVQEALGKRRSGLNAAIQQKLSDTGELSDRLLPNGLPQERVFSLFYFMNRYGYLNFVQWLLDRHRFESQILEVGYV
ncbi:MAG: bacillithiol biosynthesis BshC [Acidobacteria bacterium]|nr:bacillithiol biosynthesis BshC [Acidobacteriota bacterium]